MAEHTPSPWRWNRSENGDQLVSDALYAAWIDSRYTSRRPFVLLGIGGHGGEGYIDVENPPDEALIAAAPELLTALKALVAEVEDKDNPRDEGCSEHCEAMETARAVIVKAERG
jgi:hypothetical protein